MAEAMRLAMWSGPRNISTAMMRSWENRADAVVCDEPFYGHFLLETGIEHPGRDQVIAAMETDWQVVADALLAPLPAGASIYYQKHMCHHFLPGMEGDWLFRLRNVFLVRHPRGMLLSLARVLDKPGLFDTGLGQQLHLYHLIAEETGDPPLVLDARDVLTDPRRALVALCMALDIAFDEAMLSWPAGPRDTDGVWAPWWYEKVLASTGFAPYAQPDGEIPAELENTYAASLEIYEELAAERIMV